jgi:nucleotide-binding universal stress UspA family protein
MYKHILVALDASEPSRRGLAEALRLAAGASETTLRLVHVVKTAVGALQVTEAAYAAAEPLSETVARANDSAVRSAEEHCLQNGVCFESKLLETAVDNIGDLILEEANAWPADLIVMGTHGRSGLSRLVLGSTAEYVLHHAPVPVLMVRKA